MEINHNTKSIILAKKYKNMEVTSYNKEHNFKTIMELIKKGYSIIYR